MQPEIPKATPVQSFDQSLLAQKLSLVLGPNDSKRRSVVAVVRQPQC